ncbi:MAG TPA: PAS domain S-box protein [Planctomycetota bacterium]|nr:PAS domain S-box protein [Planctomycetota bacterium]
MEDRAHFVQFYEDDSALVTSVSAYVKNALSAGEGVAIIATPLHREHINKLLAHENCDLPLAQARAQCVLLDAEETLAGFMTGTEPDAKKFDDVVGGVIRDLQKRWPKVRAFGEMVALLWDAGNRTGACKLEALWNDLARHHSFSLFCAYPMKGFSGHTDGPSLADVCDCHSQVIPAESYSELATPVERLSMIARLQHDAQHMKAEAQRRAEAERELSDFLENALECIHKVGSDGKILWANKAELELLGYAANEYIGRHIGDFHVDRAALDNILCRLGKGENLLNHPAQLRCKDGSIKDVLIHSNGHFKSGEFVYSRCFTRDITYLKQAERDRAILAAIVECSHDAIISQTLEGKIRSWNSAAEHIFGYSAEEAVGRNISMIIPPDRMAEESDILKRLTRGDRLEHYETVRVARNGKRIDVSLSVSPLRDTSGNLIGASKVARDISERKKIEAQLRQSQEELRNLLRLLPVGVYTCEAPSGKLTYWNEQAVKLWGRVPNTGESADRYCGSHKLYTLDGSFLPHEKCPMEIALREGRAFRNIEVEVERPDGSRFIALVSIDPIRNDAGQVVGAINVFQDMSALKHAERQLKEADRRKDEFLATLAHELRNPLAPIRNSLHVLRMAGQNPAAASRVNQMMERQVAHLVRLVDDLLEVSRISRGKIELKKERLSISAIVHHAVETSKPFIESGKHSLSISVPEDPIYVEGDAVRLSQVLSNLLNNAAKYMESGGRIVLSARVENEKVSISVRDTGIGIPRDMITRVFDMFVQVENPLRRTQDGLGIGLSLVRSLVTMHGGEVEVKSDGVGCGSEFTIRLPIATKQEFKDSEQPAAQSEVDPAICRILVVDDNKDSADSLGMMLNFLGADVQVVYDGKTALESIKTLRPTIIFMDLGMPGMDGCEAARLVRQRPENKELRLVALTGWGQEEDRRRSREAGFDQHLVKPIDFDALQAVLAVYSKT